MRLDINYKKKNCKKQKHKEIIQHISNDQQITEEIKREIKNFNENMTTQNLWDTAKAVLRGKFIAIQSYLKKQEKQQIYNITLHLKQLENEEQEVHKLAEGKKS